MLDLVGVEKVLREHVLGQVRPLEVEAGVRRVFPGEELEGRPADGIHSSGSVGEGLAPGHGPADYGEGVRFVLLPTRQAGGDEGVIEGGNVEPIIVVDLAHEVISPPACPLLAY